MIPASYRQDKNVSTIELTSGVDSRGRHHFTVYWWDERFHAGPQWRAQCFHTYYGHHLERIRKSGRRAVVVRGQG